MKLRLDKSLVERGLATSRSQAENYIKLGLVSVNGKATVKPGYIVSDQDRLLIEGEQYVSRAALKLASIVQQFSLDFRGKTVLDVGSSTGGFTDYALQHGAQKVIAVDVGTDQLHPSLRANSKVDLYEKTDIRDFARANEQLKSMIDIIVADVSFVSLTALLGDIARVATRDTLFVLMCKPQFEAGKEQVNKGVIKNSSIRRRVLQDFEAWLKSHEFVVLDKADSQVAGAKGNVERFYKLRMVAQVRTSEKKHR